VEGVVWFKGRLCVPDIKLILELILKEAHETAYSMHPGSETMYQDLKKRFWWYGMKRTITEYVVIVVRELRQSTIAPQVCCSHCKLFSGNGMRLGWNL
jgi:hypothetical protein